MINDNLLDNLGEYFVDKQISLRGWTFEYFVQLYVDGKYLIDWDRA